MVAEREVEFGQNSREIPVLTPSFPPQTFLPTCPFLGSARVLGRELEQDYPWAREGLLLAQGEDHPELRVGFMPPAG